MVNKEVEGPAITKNKGGLKLITTTLFSAIITFIRVGSGFVAGKALAVLTGPPGVAIFGQFQNFINVILSIANGAINMGVVKYTAEYEGDETKLKPLFSTSLKISLYCSLSAGAILLLLAPIISEWLFLTNQYAGVIGVLGCTIVFYALNSLLVSILNGKKEIRKFTIVNTSGSIIGLVFTLALDYFYGIEGALYSLALSQSIVFFITVGLVVKSDWFKWSYFKAAFDNTHGKALARFSLMAIVSALTLPLAQIILRNVVTEKLGIDSAGYWQGMMRISDGYLYVVTTAISTYYLPKLASLHDAKDIRQEIFNGYKLILPAVLVGCVVVYLLRFFIIRTLYTAEFAEMETLFFYQLLGDLFKIAAWILSYLMLAKAMTKRFITTEIVFAITYILLAIGSIGIWGLPGLAIAFAINYLLYLVTMLWLFRKTLIING